MIKEFADFIKLPTIIIKKCGLPRLDFVKPRNDGVSCVFSTTLKSRNDITLHTFVLLEKLPTITKIREFFTKFRQKIHAFWVNLANFKAKFTLLGEKFPNFR